MASFADSPGAALASRTPVTQPHQPASPSPGPQWRLQPDMCLCSHTAGTRPTWPWPGTPEALDPPGGARRRGCRDPCCMGCLRRKGGCRTPLHRCLRYAAVAVGGGQCYAAGSPSCGGRWGRAARRPRAGARPVLATSRLYTATKTTTNTVRRRCEATAERWLAAGRVASGRRALQTVQHSARMRCECRVRSFASHSHLGHVCTRGGCELALAWSGSQRGLRRLRVSAARSWAPTCAGPRQPPCLVAHGAHKARTAGAEGHARMGGTGCLPSPPPPPLAQAPHPKPAVLVMGHSDGLIICDE